MEPTYKQVTRIMKKEDWDALYSGGLNDRLKPGIEWALHV